MAAIPEKCIKSLPELEKFLQSKTYDNFMDWIYELGTAIRGYPISPDIKPDPHVLKVSAFLDKVYAYVAEFPPVPQPMRFGNKAFQQFYDKLNANAESLLQEFLPEDQHTHIPTLKGYLMDSFGNRTRIDYGTGHEQHFAIFLYCLYKIGFFKKSDDIPVVLVVFANYIRVMRLLQKTYMLEPAGSKGVWGLDDYHFLPFLWGAAQLQYQTDIQPSDVTNASMVRLYARQFLYMDAIRAVMEFKEGAPFEECCPILSDISAVPNWKKLTDGLVKMYHGEVHRKLPVMQHLLFSPELFPYPQPDAAEGANNGACEKYIYNMRFWNSGPKSMGSSYASTDAHPSGPLGGGALGAAPWARPGGVPAGLPSFAMGGSALPPVGSGSLFGAGVAQPRSASGLFPAPKPKTKEPIVEPVDPAYTAAKFKRMETPQQWRDLRKDAEEKNGPLPADDEPSK